MRSHVLRLKQSALGVAWAQKLHFVRRPPPELPLERSAASANDALHHLNDYGVQPHYQNEIEIVGVSEALAISPELRQLPDGRIESPPRSPEYRLPFCRSP